MYSIILYTLLTILSISLFIEITHYLLYGTIILLRNYKSKKRHQTETTPATAPLPPVSVIICAKNESENIKNFLPLVLEQTYPDYEVIVVNDGSVDDTSDILLNLQHLYPHLYFTFVPEQTQIISHKKLAITIGIKAAKNDLLIFTDADCRPWTPHWIEEMVRSYTTSTEYVIGYGAYYRTGKKTTSTLIAYDTLSIALQYLGLAITGHPYMGVGRNMSYKKSTFMANKGFAGHLHIPSGDDDLLINRYANRYNTAVNTTLNAKTISVPENTFSDWYYQKKRHLSASTAYTTKSKALIIVEPIARCLFWLSTIAIAALFHSDITILVATIAVFVLKYLIQSSIINLLVHNYNERKFNPLTIIWLDVAIPVVELYITTIGRLFHRQIRWK